MPIKDFNGGNRIPYIEDTQGAYITFTVTSDFINSFLLQSVYMFLKTQTAEYCMPFYHVTEETRLFSF
jgi:hypothetical protein